jgi:DNA-directed RNA polymerase specialized sigma24 family protein
VTRPEFDAWIEQHYTELLKVAKRRSNHPEDAVQDAVVTFLTNRDLAEIDQPWTYLVNAIRSVAGNRRRGDDRVDELQRAVKHENRAGHSHGWKKPAPRAE